MCVFSGSFLRGAAGGSGASSRVSPGGAPPLFCDDDTDILRETLSLKNTRRKSVNRASSTLNWYTNRGATRDPRQATHELLHRDTALCASEADQEHSAVIFSVPHRYGLVQ